MKTKLLILGAACAIAASSVLGQTQIDLGNFDSGRIRTNSTVDGSAFSQWNGGAGNAGNVGYNATNTAYWYSAFALGAPARSTDVQNPNLFNLMSQALTLTIPITFDLGVLWTEGTPSGVGVNLYFVPGLDIPEGSLPTFANTYISNYSNVVQFASVDLTGVPDSATYSLFPPDIAAREANRVSYDLTSTIQNAITLGHLTDSTPWGIVALIDVPMTNADLVANAASGSGTVLDLTTAAITVPEPSTYAALFGFLALAGVMIRRRIKK
jgi:hypothetical protein